MIPAQISQLYQTYTGSPVEQVTALTPAGSNRRYFRLSGKQTLIGVAGTSVEENRTFIYLARHFHAKGLPVPEVHACSADEMYYLQEDLGDTLLFDVLSKSRENGRFEGEELDLLKQTIALLPTIQYKGAEDLDFSRCHPVASFDRRSILWDLNYFKYCFLKPCGLELHEGLLEDDFEQLASHLLQTESNTFMYRDFQSRNVMIKDGKPCFIDFQGGRRGPIYYDVASFLWQAKAQHPDSLRKQLIDIYIEALQPYQQIEREEFCQNLRLFVLFRTMQVLGAYGFRGYFERKPHFLQSIPFAIQNLRTLLQEDFSAYPYLTSLLQQLTDLPQFHTEESVAEGLTVRVCSFSYRRGIPEDPSGNGGGFVFDCRAVHNPGKYEQYRSLTGNDEPVCRFLEEDGEILTFLNHAYALVDAAVERYLQRGFNHLMVNFGCTGGRHRSVYSAQHMAEHLHDKYNIRVELIHREQHIYQTLLPQEKR